MQNLLMECQQKAIWIGNTIEEDAQSDKIIIKKLEDYCETLFELSTWKSKHLPEAKKNGAEVLFQRLLGYLEDVNDYVVNHISETLEIAFFPYKASMWDSLESVWLAAKEDADSDAYVVPIPYFDKNQDGTVSEMHYEGDEFPSDVPIVPWEEYDVKLRRPDVIYIHNPYDDVNKVTTVHLDFYARELKKYTDMLVYIPYFVCFKDMMSEQMCVLPGTMFADRVFVQSERVREIYIRKFHKFEMKYHLEGKLGIAEEKFIAIGSPKYDKVMQTTKQNVEMPEEWKNKIIRTDGSRRKVLLYNTSIYRLLEEKDRVLKKMQAVFEVLKNREDTILLWRPHPLSEAAYDAMRPELAQKYHELVAKYQKEKWGIYDNTPDLHRAIAVSDAYYGDGGSLVELYRFTGKPVLIQNINRV